MPDIDTDFDDDGRQKVIDYVVQKYGRNQVAQIITYGTMAAKMSIKDVARVLDLPLNESNELTKLVPDSPGIELARVFDAPIDGDNSLKEKEGLNAEEINSVKRLREIIKGDDLQAKVLKEARLLEGSVRNTGVHAAGIIIAPQDLTDLLPIATAKDSDLYVTQFEGKVVEEAGVIKMDFLGLKTLTIIKGALELIRQNHGIVIDIDNIPLDDKQTFELYQHGETNATFQFESPGMQKYLRELKPDKFDDLIAMNALYRPGPIEYIPNFIARKNGKEPVSYDLPDMEEFLKDTYGITVYQEQVMLLSQKLAGFTKGDADILRKAMGKKDKKTLDKLKPQFISSASQKGHEHWILEKIWTDWEAFASYAFNKSHSTCYAYVAFQTAYLKAHYPGEYMASVLNSASSIDKITFFMDECRRIGINVLGPDVNESNFLFTVNKKGDIRFGIGSIKGVGENAVAAVIEERTKNVAFSDIYNFVERVNLSSVSRKTFENFVIAGAFDNFGLKRSQYFLSDEKGIIFIENILRYGNRMQADKSSTANTLFGGMGSAMKVNVSKPEILKGPEWGQLEQLNKEKELVGIYLSAHPLDPYRFEFEYLCTHKLADLTDLKPLKGKDIIVAGLVTEFRQGITKTNKPYATIIIEDFTNTYRFNLFGKDFVEYSRFFGKDWPVLIKAKILPRQYGDTNELEFKPFVVYLLNEAREELIKLISLKVPVNTITDDLITELGNTIETKDGKVLLKFIIFDPVENLKIDMISRTLKLKVSNGFINFIKSKPEIEFVIN